MSSLPETGGVDRPTRPKETSYTYGEESQRPMVEKYRNRANNHWKHRIALAQRLVTEHVTPHQAGRPVQDQVVLDVGCSIGTFALEFARLGYRAYGVDFDPVAIRIARDLAREEGMGATFLEMDVADWSTSELPRIDAAVCMDIFEHLHDDELGALLQSLKRNLSRDGRVVFSTTPTQYSYLWAGGSLRLRVVRTLLLAGAWLPSNRFERFFRATAALLDAAFILKRGRDHRELIKREKHCNPLTRQRLEDIFLRAGYTFDLLETNNQHHRLTGARRAIARHPIAHTHIIGAAHVQ